MTDEDEWGCLWVFLLALVLFAICANEGILLLNRRDVRQLEAVFPEYQFRAHWWWGTQVLVADGWIDAGNWRPCPD